MRRSAAFLLFILILILGLGVHAFWPARSKPAIAQSQPAANAVNPELSRPKPVVAESQPGASNPRTGLSEPNESIASLPKLQQTAQKFADMLESGSPDELMSYVSQGGLTIGVDTDPMASTLIRHQMERKEGVFCLLFDSNCLRKEDREKRQRAHAAEYPGGLYSYRDLLRGARAKKLVTHEQQSPTGPYGNLTIHIENGDEIRDNKTLEMEFVFIPEKEDWKLSAILYD